MATQKTNNRRTPSRSRSKKSYRRKIGTLFIALLSIGITAVVSVGATLAFFAGSTTANNALYMGGPVYVEITGRNNDFKAGNGNLDITAFAGRTTGTAGTINNTILLPGQKVEIHSSARVYSTTETSTVEDNPIPDTSTGANTGNIGNAYTDSEGNAYYVNNEGRVTTTTTSIIRARFGIDIEFDPTVGFNNFTGTTYSANYPVQSQSTFTREITNTSTEEVEGFTGAIHSSNDAYSYDSSTQTHTGRRDYVADTTFTSSTIAGAEMTAIKAGTLKSIYKWKYVSQSEYEGSRSITDDQNYAKMPTPFDGTVNASGGDSNKVPGGSGNGFYGVWILDGSGNKTESRSFYKARTTAYMNTYVEFYVNEYGNEVTRTLSSSINALNISLNNYFVSLINDSSTYIQTPDDPDTPEVEGLGMNASWLYIDPSIGNDTNSNEISTTVGGWWYLIVDNGGTITGANDTYADTPPAGITASGNTYTQTVNRSDYEATDANRLSYYLYEIVPNIEVGDVLGTNGQKKIASSIIPFVNGTFALPGDALTNVFANAKLSFTVSFQALQAFLPYTADIDNMDYTNPLLGTGKPLTIESAIPIFNEAFDYQEAGGSIGDY
ncbi:MAG: hypothetical protein E7356_03825 [Clostridiales bacterium]|nr:hypothetical protein [Clostridiales bacterium]